MSINEGVFTLSTLSLLFAFGLHVLLPPDLERYEDKSKLVCDDDSILRAFISGTGCGGSPLVTMKWMKST